MRDHMTSFRHLAWFVFLGLSWGIVPNLYRLMADARLPVSHTIFLSGIGVGTILYAADALRKKSWRVSWPVLRFSMLCAVFANIPFAMNLSAAGHVSPATMAILGSTTPLINYVVALVTGWEDASSRRLFAVLLGLASTLILIVPTSAGLDYPANPLWLLIPLSLPFLYCLYNMFNAHYWPKNADAARVAGIESSIGGLLGMPFAFALAPFGASDGPMLSAYWLIAAAIVMWVGERLAYFTLIKEKGAVYTGQAGYVATPSAVIIASLMFGGGSNPLLWVSLALLMMALWLNNTGQSELPSQQAA